MKKRALILVGACVFAFVVWLIFDAFYFGFTQGDIYFSLFLFWLFPAEFVTAVVGWEVANASIWGLVIGWAVYLFLVLGVLKAKSRVGFYVFFGVLCVTLVLDIVGAHEDMVQFWRS